MMVEFFAGQIGDQEINYSLIIALDIGFSKNKKSCGLKIGGDGAKEYTFGEAVNEVKKALCKKSLCKKPKNVCLIIEAPLSVAMKGGNPVGRCFEKKGGKTRYWYVGAGAAVALAAVRFINELKNCGSKARIHLFEGFLSFKNGNSTNEDGDDNKVVKNRKGHKEDAEELMELFKNRNEKNKNGKICTPHALDKGDICNIFEFLGCRNVLSGNIPEVILGSIPQKCKGSS